MVVETIVHHVTLPQGNQSELMSWFYPHTAPSFQAIKKWVHHTHNQISRSWNPLMTAIFEPLEHGSSMFKHGPVGLDLCSMKYLKISQYLCITPIFSIFTSYQRLWYRSENSAISSLVPLPKTSFSTDWVCLLLWLTLYCATFSPPRDSSLLYILPSSSVWLQATILLP